jgi:nucleoside-diphosphate-sugar epimerase
MRVFVTGATGFVGSAVVQELIKHGHKVLGLARTDAAVGSLAAAGAEAHRGSLEDLDSLKGGASLAEGVIHLAFIHDFNNYGRAAEADRRAIETMGAVLAGSNKPLVVTSGTLLIERKGPLATEDDKPTPNFPRKSEEAAIALAAKGVRASTVRLPPSVHGEGDHGFVPMIINSAREKKASAYVGDGTNRWPAVHRFDAAHLYRLVLEKGAAGASYHAIGDEGVPTKEIAEAIGRGLQLPVVSKSGDDAASHFGWMAMFFSLDGPASSKRTEQQLGWRPTQRGLLEDIEKAGYFTSK